MDIRLQTFAICTRTFNAILGEEKPVRAYGEISHLRGCINNLHCRHNKYGEKTGHVYMMNMEYKQMEYTDGIYRWNKWEELRNWMEW